MRTTKQSFSAVALSVIVTLSCRATSSKITSDSLSTSAEPIEICKIKIDGALYGSDFATISSPKISDISVLADETRQDGSSIRLKLSIVDAPAQSNVNIGDTIAGQVDAEYAEDIIKHNKATLRLGFVQQRNANGSSLSSTLLTADCPLGGSINYSDFKPIGAVNLVCTLSTDKIPGSMRGQLWKKLLIANQANFKYRLYTNSSDGRVTQGDTIEIYTSPSSLPAEAGTYNVTFGGLSGYCPQGGSLKLSDLR